MQFPCIYVYSSLCQIHTQQICILTQPYHHGEPEDELKCTELNMEQSTAPVRPVCVYGTPFSFSFSFFSSFFMCWCICVCVPRLPLLPMLGSLASAIQLYSGGMETGLRSPGTTNQQSECWLGGGGGVWDTAGGVDG